MDSKLRFESSRKFGVEVEVLSFDKRDFKLNRLQKGELPKGIEEVAQLIMDKFKVPAAIKGWHLTHNNDQYVLKPDSSCGIEICTPVMKGTHGINMVDALVRCLSEDPRIQVDDRCGLHVHANMENCQTEELFKVLGYWIKCEKVFLDSVPDSRKRNRYCQMIGMNPIFDCEHLFGCQKLLELLGNTKYYTLNTYHMYRGNRSTIEFRIGEGAGCLNPVIAKNWTRLVLHFIERARLAKPIEKYKSGDSWTGFCWLGPKQVFDFLGFTAAVDDELRETRDWFLSRLKSNINSTLPGLWSGPVRAVEEKELQALTEQFGQANTDVSAFAYSPKKVEAKVETKPEKPKKKKASSLDWMVVEEANGPAF